MQAPQRILVIQLRRIGDLLLATPMFRALRAAYPAAEITLLVERPFEPVVRCNTHLDHVIVSERKQSLARNLRDIVALRRARYDLVIDFLGKPRTALWSWLTGAPRRIGYAAPGRRFFYTDNATVERPDDYTVLHKAVLLQPLGIAVTDLRLEFPVAAADQAWARDHLAALGAGAGARLAAIAPGTRREDKLWPADRFAAVADRLVEAHGLTPLFICGPGEEDQIEAVRRLMKRPSLAGAERPPLPRVQALLERCALFVGNDTGLRHMAVAAGLPTVAIFGQPRAVNWTPPDDPRHRSLDIDPDCKRHCTFPQCGRECLTGISVEAVLQAVDGVLAAGGKSSCARQ